MVTDAKVALTHFLNVIKQEMASQKMTRTALAKKLKISRPAVTHMLHGTNITFDTAAKLTRAVGLCFDAAFYYRGRCDFCGAADSGLVSRLRGDPDYKLCRTCTNDRRIPTEPL
jgi:transcriptional regulator with XRE-family HTH domain